MMPARFHLTDARFQREGMSYNQDSNSMTIPSRNVSKAQIHINDAHIENTAVTNCNAQNSSPSSAIAFNQSGFSIDNFLIPYFKCDQCEFAADSQQGLASHSIDQHMISCSLCIFSCLTSSTLLQHMECDHVNEITDGESASKAHNMRFHEDPCLVCLSCDFLTHSFERLVKHTKDEHPGRPPRSVAAVVSKSRNVRVRQDDAAFNLVSLDRNVAVPENLDSCKNDMDIMKGIYDADIKPFDLNCPAINPSQEVPNTRPDSTGPITIMLIKSDFVEEILEEATPSMQPDSTNPIDIEPIKSVLVEEILEELKAPTSMQPDLINPINVEPIKSDLMEKSVNEIRVFPSMQTDSTDPIKIEPIKSVLMEEILEEIRAVHRDCSTPLSTNIVSVSQNSLDHAPIEMNECVPNASGQIKEETVEYAQEAGELRQEIGEPAPSSDCDTDNRRASDSNVHISPVPNSFQEDFPQERERNPESKIVGAQRRVRIRRGAKKAFNCEICDKAFMEKIHLTTHVQESHPITEEPEDNLQISESSFPVQESHPISEEPKDNLQISKSSFPVDYTVQCQLSDISRPQKECQRIKHSDDVQNESDESDEKGKEHPPETGTKQRHRSPNGISDSEGTYCELCDISFTKKEDLRAHEKRLCHSILLSMSKAICLDKESCPGEYNPGSCPHCLKPVGNLKVHIRRNHTGYPCTICNKAFKNKQHLEMHTLQLHFDGENDDLAVCEICGKSLEKLRHLRHHIYHEHGPHLARNCVMAAPDRSQDKLTSSQVIEKDPESEYNPGPCLHTQSTHTSFPCTLCDLDKTEFVCRICYKGFNSIKHLKIHTRQKHEASCLMDSGNVSSEFACRFCSYASDKQEVLLDHIMETHCTLNQTEEESNEKNNQTTNLDSLDKENTKEKNAEDSCPYCFKEVNDLRSHIQNTHIGFMCSFCGGTFKTKSHLKRHTLYFHLDETKDDRAVCEFCGKDFKMVKDLRTHIYQVHGGPLVTDSRKDIYPCQLCDCAFPTSLFLEMHMKNTHKKAICKKSNKGKTTGDGTETLQEEDTNSNMETSGNMAKVGIQGAVVNAEENPTFTGGSHENLIENISQLEATVQEKLFQCNKCDKSFRIKKNYLIHIKTHKKGNQGKKSDHVNTRINAKKHPFKCTTCSKTFSCSSNLYKHMRTHTGEKKFKCSMCPKAYADSSNLKKHEVYSHTDEKPYKCDECAKTFRTHGCLMSHVRGHTGEKPFACDKCNKTFRFRSSLKHHAFLHTGVKPYQCNDCGRRFSFQKVYNKHVKNIHQKTCKFCGLQFSNVKEHIKQSHKREKPYKCKICGFYAKDNYTLLRHFKQHE